MKALFKALRQYEFSHFADWVPTSEEKRIWSKITSPKSYDKMVNYFAEHRNGINKVALKFYQKAIEEAAENRT